MVQNILAIKEQVVGIDIGRAGNIALSTGFRMKITKLEDVQKLFRQLSEYSTITIALEEHSNYDKSKRSRLRGLLVANDLIARYARSRPFGYMPIVYVDKFKSSIICNKCRFVDRASRVETWLFICTACGEEVNADVNAALNIKHAAEEKIQMGILL